MKKKKENLNLLKFSMFLRAGMIDSGPPLSTILGNCGVNTIIFCKELNEFTKGLPSYFLLEIVITVNNDRSYSFYIKDPSVAFLLKLISFKYEIKFKGSGGLKSDFIRVINLKDLYLVCIFKFNSFNISTLKMVCGILASSKIYVI